MKILEAIKSAFLGSQKQETEEWSEAIFQRVREDDAAGVPVPVFSIPPQIQGIPDPDPLESIELTMKEMADRSKISSSRAYAYAYHAGWTRRFVANEYNTHTALYRVPVGGFDTLRQMDAAGMPRTMPSNAWARRDREQNGMVDMLSETKAPEPVASPPVVQVIEEPAPSPSVEKEWWSAKDLAEHFQAASINVYSLVNKTLKWERNDGVRPILYRVPKDGLAVLERELAASRVRAHEMRKMAERAHRTHPRAWPLDAFSQFWAAYPRKVSKSAALKVFNSIQSKGKVDFEALMAGVLSYRQSQIDPQFIMHPDRWLRNERWNDETPPPAPKPVLVVRETENLKGFSEEEAMSAIADILAFANRHYYRAHRLVRERFPEDRHDEVKGKLRLMATEKNRVLRAVSQPDES